MKLTKRLVTISTAATAAVLLSAGGAQAQDDGDFLSFLGSTTLPQASTPVQVGHGNTYIGTQNINTNNNIGGGVNNNNNNNNGGGSTQSHDDEDSGLSSLLRKAALVPASYSVQVGEGNSYTETQNNNTNNNTGGGTNNNNNNNGGGVNNNNNNNNTGGGRTTTITTTTGARGRIITTTITMAAPPQTRPPTLTTTPKCEVPEESERLSTTRHAPTFKPAIRLSTSDWATPTSAL